ncbi:hypothetical protein GYB61_12225 [bacterium]|nr:hypothetical protein [bacterium]
MRGALILAAPLVAGLLLRPVPAMAQAVAVELQQTEQGWQLLRDGQPYFIRGAGGVMGTDGAASLASLKAAGANSVRTWGSDANEDFLDAAHALGLTVAVGLWLGHERHGFDYRDSAQVQAQRQRIGDKVRQIKDHPAVLLWGVGNEMEGFDAGDDPVIWNEVNAVAAMVKALDPAHPTMTVTAFAHGGRVEFVHRRSPAIDIHGVNAYGSAGSLLQVLREGQATKPVVLTEFGPIGPWEAQQTSWGAPLEQTSTQKAAAYRAHYAAAVTAGGSMSLGAYAFLWGHKMEGTETWFGMSLADGSPTAAVDAMTEIWSGTPPDNLAPVVRPLALTGSTEVEPGARIQVRANATDPEGKALRAQWALKPESGDYLTGGDSRATPPAIKGAVVASAVEQATVEMPDTPGACRLYYTVYDTGGKAGTANIPLRVLGEPATLMPVVVYADGLENMPWAPSGWMGQTDKLSLDGQNTDNPHSGEAAIKIRYTGQFGWAGIAWQHPANNWGDLPGGLDLVGANKLEFWARGAYGGETVEVGMGLIKAPKPHPDSGSAKLSGVVLKHTWQRYTVPLKGVDLSSIKTGFYVTLEGRQSPVTIYLDDIRFTR